MNVAEDEREEQATRERMRVRVQAGMKALDELEPDWMEIIDLSMLDLGESSCCIIGQTENVLNVYLDDLGVGDESHLHYPPSLGMELDDDDLSTELATARLYSMLTEEWVQAISERRAASSSRSDL